jgi:hypothetical protein
MRNTAPDKDLHDRATIQMIVPGKEVLRQLNPRGVRKLDVQKERRQMRRDAKAKARDIVHRWFIGDGPGVKIASADELRRLAEVCFSMGWEQGVKDAHKAGLARIDEAIKKGTLIKP